ncbi:MAG: YCF48-related protein, partial [Bacteroidales bacterium]|nr:YCF48-related protein [Bacteroidales bacterium]
MKTPANNLRGLVTAILLTLPFITVSQLVGWHWQNPYLQGNDLNSIVMNGSVGWAAGAMGTLMKTTNEGFDWELIDLGTSENFNCIYMDGVSGRGWVVGNNGIVFYTDDGGDSWVKQRSGTSEILYSVTAIEGDCPWICGNDVIFRSYNHGETWEKVNSIFHD